MSPRTVALLLVACSALAACQDSTGPDGPPPGRRLVDGRELTEWRWLPGSDEIVFSTPFDYPYSGPPTRFDAVSASTGARRTVVAPPPDGRRIVGYRFAAVGAHVYFQVSRPSVEALSLVRAPIAGGAAPQVLMDSAALMAVASPDERTIAWVAPSPTGLAWMLVLQDVATGERRYWPLSQPGDRVTWSPSGRSVVVDPENSWFATGTPFQLVDVATGSVRVLLAPGEHTSESSRDIGWEGETAFLYSAGPVTAVRWNIATGAREQLAMLGEATTGLGWSADFATLVVATSTCLEWSTGPFAGSCLRYRSSIDRVTWRTGARANVLRHEGPTAIGGRVSPDGNWLAFHYGRCGGGCYSPGDGLYVVAVR